MPASKTARRSRGKKNYAPYVSGPRLCHKAVAEEIKALNLPDAKHVGFLRYKHDKSIAVPVFSFTCSMNGENRKITLCPVSNCPSRRRENQKKMGETAYSLSQHAERYHLDALFAVQSDRDVGERVDVHTKPESWAALGVTIDNELGVEEPTTASSSSSATASTSIIQSPKSTSNPKADLVVEQATARISRSKAKSDLTILKAKGKPLPGEDKDDQPGSPLVPDTTNSQPSTSTAEGKGQPALTAEAPVEQVSYACPMSNDLMLNLGRQIRGADLNDERGLDWNVRYSCLVEAFSTLLAQMPGNFTIDQFDDLGKAIEPVDLARQRAAEDAVAQAIFDEWCVDPALLSGPSE